MAMSKNNNYNNLNDAFDVFKRSLKILSEDYGIGYGDEEFGHGVDGQELPVSQKQLPVKNDDEGEYTDTDLSQKDMRIAKIREIALEGLQDYARDVDSEPYQFYKKIWLMCDKAVSEKDSASNGNVV